MRTYLNRAMDLILGSVVHEKLSGDGLDATGMVRAMNVNLIVMSRETAREIMRHDYGRQFRKSMIRTEPDRLGPARVAYDDSLGPGEFLIAEAIVGH